MPRRGKMSPRKEPRQARAKATVDAILDATAQVLIREGYEGASTNRVARVAGVSVGSLYQYFPNKEAMVAAVIDRHCEEMGALIESKILELAAAPIPVAARELVSLLLDAHALDPMLHQVLVEQVPRVGKMARLRQVEERIGRILRAYLEPRREEIRPRNMELAIFILVTAVEALGHAAVTTRGDQLTRETVDEITAMVVRYLLPLEQLAKLETGPRARAHAAGAPA